MTDQMIEGDLLPFLKAHLNATRERERKGSQNERLRFIRMYYIHTKFAALSGTPVVLQVAF